MFVANGFVPATFSIKCGPSFADDLPSEKRSFTGSSRTGSSSTGDDELYEVGFNRAQFVRPIDIGGCASNLMAHAFPIKVFLCFPFMRCDNFHFYCQPYDELAFSSGQDMGSSGQ
jgi:hypothetical protein